MYTVNCTLCTVHCTIFTVHFSHQTLIYCWLYTVRCSLHTVHFSHPFSSDNLPPNLFSQFVQKSFLSHFPPNFSTNFFLPICPLKLSWPNFPPYFFIHPLTQFSTKFFPQFFPTWSTHFFYPVFPHNFSIQLFYTIFHTVCSPYFPRQFLHTQFQPKFVPSIKLSLFEIYSCVWRSEGSV